MTFDLHVVEHLGDDESAEIVHFQTALLPRIGEFLTFKSAGGTFRYLVLALEHVYETHAVDTEHVTSLQVVNCRVRVASEMDGLYND